MDDHPRNPSDVVAGHSQSLPMMMMKTHIGPLPGAPTIKGQFDHRQVIEVCALSVEGGVQGEHERVYWFKPNDLRPVRRNHVSSTEHACS